MKAQSKVYVQLQNIYKSKARKDAAEVLETVQALPGGRDIDPAEVELYCKNAAFVKLINAVGPSSDDRLATVTRKLLLSLRRSPQYPSLNGRGEPHSILKVCHRTRAGE